MAMRTTTPKGQFSAADLAFRGDHAARVGRLGERPAHRIGILGSSVRSRAYRDRARPMRSWLNVIFGWRRGGKKDTVFRPRGALPFTEGARSPALVSLLLRGAAAAGCGANTWPCAAGASWIAS